MQVRTGWALLAKAIPSCAVLPVFSVDSSLGLYIYLGIFSFELKTHSRFDACAAVLSAYSSFT